MVQLLVNDWTLPDSQKADSGETPANKEVWQPRY